jgi:hypothetical protein
MADNEEIMRLEFSAEEASRLSGARQPQIQHLVQSGCIRPTREAFRRGVSRRFDFFNVAEIAVAYRLLEHGLSVRAVSAAVEFLRGIWCDMAAPNARADKAILFLWRGATHDDRFGPWEGVACASPERVAEWLREGRSGISINLRLILQRLEQDTGIEIARQAAQALIAK